MGDKNDAAERGKPDGGPAFPRPTSDMPGQVGMMIRDYFAGQALVGLLAFSPEGLHGAANQYSPEQAAEQAYRFADAMIRERAKR